MPPLERIGQLEAQQEALRLELAPAAAYAPTTARYPAGRGDVPTTPAPAQGAAPTAPPGASPRASREYESFDWYEAATIVLAANTTFQEVIAFSGRVGRVDVQISAVPVFVRFRNRGEQAGSAIRLGATGTHQFRNECEITEVQDAAGLGGQTITVTGHHPSRAIAIRALTAPEPAPTP